MAYPSQFSDIYNKVIQNLRLDAVNDLGRTKDAVNRVYFNVVVETEANTQVATSTLTAGTNSYVLPSGISRVKTMVCTPVGGFQTRPLLRWSQDKMLTMRSAAAGPGTNNGSVYAYCILGLSEFEVYPTPQSADTLTIYYTATPTALSGDTDTPIIPEPYATECLVYGACFDMSLQSGDPDMAFYQQLFEDGKQRLRTHLNRLRGRLTDQFEVQDDKLWPPHDPSIDVRGSDWVSGY